jgi:hypothetical protein
VTVTVTLIIATKSASAKLIFQSDFPSKLNDIVDFSLPEQTSHTGYF